MLTALAHAGEPLAPHDLWAAWARDPVVVVVLLAVSWMYARGGPGVRSASGRRSAVLFAGGVAALFVALVSPLEPLSGALASAHMLQHLLLVVVAGPLLAASAPGARLLRGLPRRPRRALARRAVPLGRRTHAATPTVVAGVAAAAHTAALWLWHSRLLYDAALAHPLLHVAEHALFLGTAILVWRAVIGGRTARRVAPGVGILLLFVVSMQSVFLSLLLTFAREPFYGGYTDTTAAWGLTPLADQQLAGALMWVPAGAIYLGVALVLLRRWLAAEELEATGPVPASSPVPPPPPAPRSAEV